MNDDGDPDDDKQQLQRRCPRCAVAARARGRKPIRIFPIAYGRDADLDTLRTIAEATNSAVYDASDPKTITKVFTAVVSNF